MNERYLFRGKRIDGFKKTWVTGHYVSAPRPMIVATKTRIGGGWDADDMTPPPSVNALVYVTITAC